MLQKIFRSSARRAVSLIAAVSVAAMQGTAVMPAIAADDTEVQNVVSVGTENNEKLTAQPCLSIESKVVPASDAGKRVVVTVYINDENMGDSKYFQQPCVYIDFDGRLTDPSFKNGTLNGTKGMGLVTELMFKSQYRNTVKMYSEKGVGNNGVYATIEVTVPKYAQPGDIFYFDICDTNEGKTRLSITDSETVQGEKDKAPEFADTGDDEYLKGTNYDGYILIDPESEPNNNGAERTYKKVVSDSVAYAVFDDHAEVAYCEYDAEAPVIKSEIDGKKVTSIADKAFWATSVSTVAIPDTIEAIGESAFCNSRLDSLVIPDSVTSIGGSAFKNCDIEELSIPDSVTVMGGYIFQASKIKSIKLPKNIAKLTVGMFMDCTELSSVTIPDSVEQMDYNTFAGCTSLSELNLPENLRFIPSGMCTDCTSLAEIEIPSKVERIMGGAFENTALTSVEVPSRVDTISIYAFAKCSKLESITLASGIKKIDAYAFSDCPLLTSIELPDTLEFMGSAMFKGTNIIEVNVPSSVRTIDERAFYKSNVETINYSDELKRLPDYAYAGADKLKTVKLPAKLTAIPNYAFCGCTSLESVDIPDTVTSIGRYAFDNCGVKEIKLPEGLTDIGRGAFSAFGLETIEIPESFTTLPSEMLASSSIKTVKLPSGLTAIPEEMFYGCRKLESIEIPDTVKSIGEAAFSGCSSLKSITIPDSVEKIGSSAFEGTGLRSVVIPESVTSLDTANLFSDCSLLESVTLPETLENIGACAFYNCVRLQTVDIPESVTAIYDNAFSGTTFGSIYIPASVTTISRKAIDQSLIYTVFGEKGSAAERFAVSRDRKFLEAVSGDANCDENVDMADVVLIMQSLANPDRYGLKGLDRNCLTIQGAKNGDVDKEAKGLTSNDALRIQEYLLGKVEGLL